ncbi:MAG: hypothetical protein PHV39_06355, partial [Methanomicrobium sp.]|nr:hypothetical protein [Methanomicrobium sp.]
MIINKNEELLRIYKNKKGEIKYDFSQMKDKDSLMIIQRIIEPETNLKREETKNEPPKDKNKTPNAYAQNNAQKTWKSAEENIIYNPPYPIIGTDESGKG